MSDSAFGRRGFLVGSGLGLGALLIRPTAPAHAEGGKVSIPLAKLEMLKSVDGSVVFKVKDKLLLLVRDSAASIRAFNPVCSHRQCVVAYSPGEKRIKCPCHGSVFDLNGHALRGPASQPLQTYAASLSGEQVIVTL